MAAKPRRDGKPNAFSFAAQTNVAVNADITSAAITLSGINIQIPVSVSGGSMSKNDGVFTTVSTTAQSGDSFRVRVRSSGSNGVATTATLNANGVAGSFSATTQAVDPPDAFSFTAVTNAELNTEYTSNTITIAGTTGTIGGTILNGSYSKNGAAYLTLPFTCTNGDTFRVRRLSSLNYSTAVSAVLTAGGVSGTYTITTKAAPGGYPAGVLAAGCEVAYDTQTTAGLSNPGATFKTPLANFAELPAGSSIGGSGQGQAVYLPTSGIYTLTDWNFTGYIVYIDGTAQVTFSNTKLWGNGRYFSLALNFNSGSGAKAYLNDCDCNCAGVGITFLFEAPFYLKNGATLEALRTKFYGAQGTCYISGSADAPYTAVNRVTMNQSYMASLGELTTSTGQHMEGIHLHHCVGVLTLIDSFINFLAGKSGGLGNLTGIINPEADHGSMSTTATRSIQVGALVMGGNYNVQIGATSPITNTFVSTSSVYDSGTSAYFSSSGAAFSGSGNRDYTTAALLTLP